MSKMTRARYKLDQFSKNINVNAAPANVPPIA